MERNFPRLLRIFKKYFPKYFIFLAYQDILLGITRDMPENKSLNSTWKVPDEWTPTKLLSMLQIVYLAYQNPNEGTINSTQKVYC